jgi:hypothetical protein
MSRTRKLLLYAGALVSLSAVQSLTAPQLQAKPFATCDICDVNGCEDSATRHELCLSQCNIADPLPACNYWGGYPCYPEDGKIFCNGEAQ